MHDVISIGDVTIDNYVQIHDVEVRCNLDKSKCMLCLEYGDKIPVDHLSHQIGGNAANNAVGSARLKLRTAIYVNCGDDYPSKQIKDKLKEEGVDERYLVINKGMESNLSTIISFKGERTILVYHYPWDYDLPDLDKTKWIYFSSISHSFSKTHLIPQIEQYVERTGANLVYTPGTHQLTFGVKKYPRLLSLTKVFIVNKEEAKTVLGIDEDKKVDIKHLLEVLLNLGPKMVVITDGGEGSYGFDGEKFYKIGLFPAKLLEMTGAGDAYATGLLSGLFHGKDLKEAMRWGAANGASVVEQIGPQAGLLTYNQMQEKLRENSKITAKEI